MLKIDVDAEKVVAKLAKTENAFYRKELLKAMRPGVKEMSKAVKSRAPQAKGILKRSVTIKPLKGRAKDASAGYFVAFRKIYPYKGKMTTPYYALFVHNGTVISQGKRKHRKRTIPGAQKIKPNPFVWDAFEAKADSVGAQIITDILGLTNE